MKNDNTKRRYYIFTGLLLLCLLFKVVPHSLGLDQFAFPWNFSPLYAICLLMGATCRGHRFSGAFRYLAPMLLLVVGDIVIAMLSWSTGNKAIAFHKVQLAVYATFLMIIAMGWLLRKERTVWSVGLTGFTSALLFFVVTNFATWALGGGKPYPLNATGLLNCYVVALPFFRNTLIAMAIYLPLLFSPSVLAYIEGTETVTEESPQPTVINV